MLNPVPAPSFKRPNPPKLMLRFLLAWLFTEVLLLSFIVTTASILELLPKPLLEAMAVLVSVLSVSATVVVFLLLIQELSLKR